MALVAGLWTIPADAQTPVVEANVGAYSVAFGQDVTASGSRSMAMGFGTTASGDVSTAMGSNTTASGRAVLADERQAAGRKEIALEARAWPSGVYFIQLRAGTTVQTRKITVVR